MRVYKELKYSKAEKLLQRIFWGVLAFRFALPFIISPMDNIYSDIGKHWKGANRLFDPSLVDSIEPKLYQLYLYIISNITSQNEILINIFTGVLCAAMAWLWYKACREIFPRRASLILGIIIGLTPSLTIIYGFFMNETLLLAMLGLSFWMTFRALRKKTFAAYNAAVLCWVLTSITRMIGLPFAAFGIGYLLFHRKKKLPALLSFAVIFSAIVIPAGLHSYEKLNFFSPFRFSGSNQIYRLSGTFHYGYDTDVGVWKFASPSYFFNPFGPFFEYKTSREPKRHLVQIDTKKGREDWDKEIKRLRSAYTLEQFRQDMLENIIYLYFGASWPDSEEMGGHSLKLINYHARWMWAPLLLLVFLYGPFIRTTEQKSFMLFCTWMLVFMLMIQQVGVMEGRFRKPIEPLLIISAFIACGSLWRKKQKAEPAKKFISIGQFFVRVYIGVLRDIFLMFRKSLRSP